MRHTYYAPGDWNAICDRCGWKYKASQLRLEWDGLRVCARCWEPRQPQDFIRSVPDPQGVPWSRPEAPPTFVPRCTLSGTFSTPGAAVAGCWVAGRSYVAYGLPAANGGTSL